MLMHNTDYLQLPADTSGKYNYLHLIFAHTVMKASLRCRLDTQVWHKQRATMGKLE